MTALNLPAGGYGAGRLAVRGGLAAATAILALILLFAAVGGQAPGAPTGGSGGAVNTSAIPAAYVPWVLAAGSPCAAITPAVIAAQDQTESDWNPHAVSSVGAEGIAQFLPSTFASWGRDDDGTGNVSPFNPADEIMAQGRYDCSLAALASRLLASGAAAGSVVDLALACYNAGPGQVEAAHGVPADAAAYVQEIDSLAASKYSAVSPAGSVAGLAAVAAAESALGTPYQWGGSCADPHGADPSGWCDCSSLVQMAWAAAGVSLPRTTYQQVHAGTNHVSPRHAAGQAAPGETATDPGHVVMYADDGMLIQAPTTGQPLRLGDTLLLTPAHQARIAMGTVERFCYSADPALSALHVPPVNGIDAASFAELTWRIIPHAQRAWYDITLPEGRLPFRHDHYLKMWQLTSPRIATDYIMFDEAQDANPVTASVIQSQHHVQQIAVGDSCQAIYGWRGAVDALATWPAGQRLHLSHSLRFGPAVAGEANQWLRCLGAQFQLSGTPRINSLVGAVADPNAILCRTNAEALEQARAALEADRHVRLAGDGGDIRQLAHAALELQAAGHTSNPELAAFRSWHAVRQFTRTDAAGADLAASVRLIDKWGAAAVLNLVTRLSRTERAELTVSTAHHAKGLEWGRVLVAPDFRDRRTSASLPQADAMLAYVAVTRARHELDTSGLPAAPALASGTVRGENTMNTTRTEADGLGRSLAASNGQPFEARPYQGGRAQAESGSRIIENDYDAWTSAFTQPDSTLPADHPRVLQLNQAWRAVSRYGLGDEPGAAGVRYQILAHAAAALAETATENGQDIEVKALSQLADHAGKHAARLRATAEDMYLRSRLSGPYDGGRAQASAGSRIIDLDYRAWADTATASQAVGDIRAREPARRVRREWEEAHRRGLADGPGPAATRYQAIADAADALATAFPPELPSSGLAELLQLAGHARKHAIRLRATGKGHDATSTRDAAAAETNIYRDLPAEVAVVTAQAHTSQEHPASHRGGEQRANVYHTRNYTQRSTGYERA